jgi:hypothetical protein
MTAALEAIVEGSLWQLDKGVGPPTAMSLIDVRNVKKDYFCSRKHGWYLDKPQKFARDDKVEPVWIAFRKGRSRIRSARTGRSRANSSPRR